MRLMLAEGVKVETLLPDVRCRSLSVRVNGLLASQTGDLFLADALDTAWNVVDSHGDGCAVKTRTLNSHQLATLSVTRVVADRADSRHDLGTVAVDIVEPARLKSVCVVHGIASTAEERGNSSIRVAEVSLNSARDVGF